jgi:TolA-binding protein
VDDPERLLDGGTDFERSLLQGGLAERPSAKLTRQMAVGLGVGCALSYASTAKAFMQTWWGKATAAFVVGAGVAGVVTVSQPSATPEPAVVQAPKAQPAGHSVEAAPKPEKVSIPQLDLEVVEDEAPVEESVLAKPPARAKQALPSAQSTLAQEVALLDRARTLVKQGDHAAANRVLDTYQSRYPRGVLKREARVLRVRAAGAQ